MKMNRIAALLFCLLTPSCGPDWSDCGEAGCSPSTESPEAPAPGPDIVIVIVIEVDQNQKRLALLQHFKKKFLYRLHLLILQLCLIM
jgi:hypothetical protein